MMSTWNGVEPPMSERIPQHYLHIVRATGQDLSLLIPFQAVYTTCMTLKFSFKTKSCYQLFCNLQLPLDMCDTPVLELSFAKQPHDVLFVAVPHGDRGSITRSSFRL